MSVRDAFLAGSTREKNRKQVEAVIAGNSGLYGDGSVTVAQAYARMGQKMREGEVFAQMPGLPCHPSSQSASAPRRA